MGVRPPALRSPKQRLPTLAVLALSIAEADASYEATRLAYTIARKTRLVCVRVFVRINLKLCVSRLVCVACSLL